LPERSQEQAPSLEETAALLKKVASALKQNADMAETHEASRKIADLITAVDESTFQTNASEDSLRGVLIAVAPGARQGPWRPFRQRRSALSLSSTSRTFRASRTGLNGFCRNAEPACGTPQCVIASSA